jgi:hypothetical protein
MDEDIMGIIGGADGPTSIFYSNKKDKVIINKTVDKIKPITTIVKARNEEQEKINSILEDNCDFIINEDYFPDEIMFTTDEPFHIIGLNGAGDYYGTIGGLGDLSNDIYPVGYVGHEGQCGRIGSSLMEFFELILFYPYWYDLVQNHDKITSKLIKELESERIEFVDKYTENQKFISKHFNINKNEKSIELLIDNLLNKPRFTVYSADQEANMYDNLI